MTTTPSPYVLPAPARWALQAFAWLAALTQAAIVVMQGFVLADMPDTRMVSGIWALYERWDQHPQPFTWPAGPLGGVIFWAIIFGLAGSAGLRCLAGFRLRRPTLLSLCLWLMVSVVALLLISLTEYLWIPEDTWECPANSSCYDVAFPAKGLVENLLGIWLPLLAYAILPFILLRRRRRMAAEIALALVQAPQIRSPDQLSLRAEAGPTHPARAGDGV